MFRLYKDPSGENCIDNTAQTGSSIEIGKGGALRVISDKEKIAQLQTEVLQLKSQLGEARVWLFLSFCLSPFSICPTNAM